MDVSFLNPTFLWALPAAAGPVAIHWLSRRRPRPLPFSALELLRETARSRMRRSRLRNILLLLSRCLLLAALAFLFARPVLHWGGGAAPSGEGMSVVLLLDASASMGLRSGALSAFERAREEAREFLRAAPRGDRVGIVVFSDRVESSAAPADEPRKAWDALEAAHPTFRPTRVGPALETAYEMLAGESRAQKAVVLFSDLAAHGWREAPRPPARFDPSVRLLLAEAAPESWNAEVSWARAGGSAEAGRLEGFLAARAWGKAPAARTWRVEAGGRAAAQGRLTLEKGEARVRFEAGGAAGSAAKASLEPDALEADDAYFFPLAQGGPLACLVVNGAPGLTPLRDEAYFLAPVFEPFSRGNDRFRQVIQKDLDPAELAGRDAVVLLNPAPLSPALSAALAAHLERGGGLWVTAGDNAAESLASLLPGRFGGRITAREGLAPGPSAASHPLGRTLTEGEGFEWGKVVVEQSLRFEPVPGAQVLLAGAESGNPALTVGRVRAGRVAVLSTTADRDWTNFPTKPLFPVLARELLNYLAGRAESAAGARSFVVGEEARMGLRDAALAAVEVERPDGETESVDVRKGAFAYARTDRPGVYRVSAPGRRETLISFAVNVDRSLGEGDLARVPRAEVDKRLPARDVVWVRHPSAALPRFQERVRGKDMTAPLASAALALFALESLLAPRRRTSAKEAAA